MDAYFDDEPGYRVRADHLALPDISLTADEVAVVGLATKVWQHAKLARATTEAVRKLTALGADLDVSALDIVEPRLNADEPSFDVFLEATQERQAVSFDYRRPGQTDAATRHLQPWGVTRYSGRWYVVGLDTDRDAERVFRLSRVEGQPRRPDARRCLRGARRRGPRRGRPAARARRAQRPGRRCWSAREPGCPCGGTPTSLETDIAGPDGASGWDRLAINRGSTGYADEILGLRARRRGRGARPRSGSGSSTGSPPRWREAVS